MFSIHYSLPVRSDLGSIAGVVNVINEMNGIIISSGTTGPTGSSITGPTGSSGGGGSLQKGIESIDTFSQVLSYTGTISFDTPFSEVPVVVGSCSWGSMNITDTKEGDFSYSLSTSFTDPNFVTITGAFSAQPILSVVNLRPSFAFINGGSALAFIRANDIGGTSWPSSSIIIDNSSSFNNQLPGMNIVNGFPVVSYYGINNELFYVSATDVDGTAWNAPILVDGTLQNFGGDFSDILIIDGKPTISYSDYNTSLLYAYSTVATPTSSGDWVSMIVVADTVGLNYSFPEIKIVGGNPAIVYISSSGVYMVRSNIAFPTQDTDWGTPVLILAGTLYSVSFEIVNSKPVIVTWLSGNIKYITSSDDGDTWDIIANIPVTSTSVSYIFKVINNIPTICFTNDQASYRLTCVLAENLEGTSWGTPFVLSTTYRSDSYIQLLDNNGLLNILFFDTNINRPVYMTSVERVVKLYYIAS